MKISDSIEIEVAPKVVFDWLSQLDDHYREWHPDHRACYWLKGNGLSPGAGPLALYPHKTHLPGLFLAGQTTYPGFGAGPAAVSGILAAEALLAN